jgi:hypothetical protein
MVTGSEDVLDRAVFSVLQRLPGRVIVAAGLMLYPGLGLIVPVMLHWSVIGLIAVNVLGTLYAGVLAIGWLALQIQARDRRHLVEWTTNLRLLAAEEFEWLVGEVFRREGLQVNHTGRNDGPDGNIDLELTSQGRRMIVQCKRWQAWKPGVDEVRAFAGTLMREGLAGDAGIFVTLSGFTPQARTEAEAIGLTLIDGPDLYRRIEKVRRTEHCPICQAPMVFDRSLRGWWFRCTVPGCRGKRDLSNDTGRAVEILTAA